MCWMEQNSIRNQQDETYSPSPAPMTETAAARKVKSIEIHGRRAYRAGYVYQTATIIVNGEHVHTTTPQTGYGDAYFQIASVWLEANNYLPPRRCWENGGRPDLYQHCRALGIALSHIAIEVETVEELAL